MRRRRAWIVIAVLCAVVAAVITHKYPRIRWMISHYQADSLPVSSSFVHIPVEAPSGIVFHAKRGTLIAVSDKGQLVEMDGKFNVLQRLDVKGDLEGLSVHPDTGTVFIASESGTSVMEYDLDEHRVIRTLHIDLTSNPEFGSGLTWNKGIEGVTVVTTASGEYRLLVAVEAHPCRVLRLSADVSSNATAKARESCGTGSTGGLQQTVEVGEVHDVGLTRISDIAFDVESGMLLIVSAGERVLTLADPSGRTFRSFRLPGEKPEGICLLPNGDALVVDDTGGAWALQDGSGFIRGASSAALRSGTRHRPRPRRRTLRGSTRGPRGS